MSQRSARLCLKQLNPIAAWLGEGGAALTSNHISGAAVLEYGPTEISAPLQAIWTSKCASLPTTPPTQPPIPARLARFSTGNGWVCARHGLSAGGRWIRTSGTAAQKPWISVAFWGLRGHRRAPNRYPRDGSALLLLRTTGQKRRQIRPTSARGRGPRGAGQQARSHKAAYRP